MKPIVALLLLASACHEHSHAAGIDEYVFSCEKASEGTPFVSDEAFMTFVNAEAAGKVKVDDERAPMLVEPKGNVSAGTPPRITLRVGTMAAAPGCPRSRRPGWGARLASALALERRAEAHCPAVSGEVHLLRIVNAANPQDRVYTALLSVTTFTPSAEIWRKALGGRGAQTLAVTVLRATFSKGDVTEGPFVASRPVTLTVTP